MTDLIASDRTADRLLFLLKMHGSLTTAELARRLAISIPAVRGHLGRLGDGGLLGAESVRAGVGRPAQYWSLTGAGHACFPDKHAETLVGILDALRTALGQAALIQVIAARVRETEAEYRGRLAACGSLHERLIALAELLSRDGYMAEVIDCDDGGWVLAENHCPICAAARSCQQFCHFELDMFRSLLGQDTEVTRSEYLLDGGRRCAYQVRARKSA
jgi:predicted ArsR family transcriptional regulator